MTERERLAELIRSAIIWGYDTPDAIAERLIDDGVICPTHKAGDEIMNERERLIKLLDECIEAEFPWDHNGPIADHLLHHGVLVFPCNVGTPVYTLSPDKQHYYKTRAFPLATLAKWVQNGDFGKNIFLTREEAEAALAERRKG